MEMTCGGKRGKPKAGFPRLPQHLEIAPRFPHFHNLDDYGLYLNRASPRN
jgi:hypothetical protein